jgi:hypothetical protein
MSPFFNYLESTKTFVERKTAEYEMGVPFFFSTAVVRNIFYSNKYMARLP